MTHFNKDTSTSPPDFAKYLQKGIDYAQYKLQMAEDLVANANPKTREYIQLNQSRMRRVEKTYEISPVLAEQIAKRTGKTIWLIMTEHWCGDAAQTLPALHKMAESSGGKIEIKLVYRDQNPELMDAFLTNGTRSIPKLIQLDENNNLRGTWGPRPATAQQLVKQLKSDPATAATYANELHSWYAKDKQQLLETEIKALLQ